MQIVESVEALRIMRRSLRGRVGVVPTMGALHHGHLSLVETAKADNDAVLVTIFVNPLQFSPNEDLNRYPRDLPRDLALLESVGVDAVFTPTPHIMYPAGFQTSVNVSSVSQVLEGERRPNHFEGVATVVSKLFNLTQPDRVYLGQKDAQQVVVIKRMVRDLDFLLEIVVCPTTRESSGLAMSSRNVFLSPDQRMKAGTIWQGMSAAAAAYNAGERYPAALKQVVMQHMDESFIIDYISLNDPTTLAALDQPTDHPMLLSLAVRLGTTRLIDNQLLPVHLNNRADLSQQLGG